MWKSSNAKFHEDRVVLDAISCNSTWKETEMIGMCEVLGVENFHEELEEFVFPGGHLAHGDA